MASNTTQYVYDEDFLTRAIKAEVGIEDNSDVIESTKESNSDDRELDKEVEEIKKEVLDEALKEELDLEQEDSEEEDNREQEETVSQISEDDVYSLVLETIKEEGLLYIPDDFDGELDADTLDFFREKTMEIRDRQILESRRNQFADDPEKLRLFDYFFIAEENANLPKFQQINEDLTKWENYSIESEENQKSIIKAYLQDGLNPDNPSFDILSKDIDTKVDDILNNYEGEEYAKKAKAYFVDKQNKLMEEEVNRVNELKQQQELYESQLEQSRIDWNNNLQNLVKKSEWSNAKKQALLREQYSEVKMGDEYVPVWYAKESLIKNDPALYLTYLDWLSSSFDLNKGQFIKNNNSISEEKNKNTNRILERIKKKHGIDKPHEYSPSGGSADNSEQIVVNPLDMI